MRCLATRRELIECFCIAQKPCSCLCSHSGSMGSTKIKQIISPPHVNCVCRCNRCGASIYNWIKQWWAFGIVANSWISLLMRVTPTLMNHRLSTFCRQLKPFGKTTLMRTGSISQVLFMVRSSSNTASTSDLKHPFPPFKDHKNRISFDAWITDHENNMYAFDNLVHCCRSWQGLIASNIWSWTSILSCR